jgi:Flp pilus assembly protein TadD
VAAFLAVSALVSPAAAELGEHYSLYGDYLAGRFAVSQRDNEAAAEFFREALRKDPDNVSIVDRAFNLEVATAHMESATKLAERLVKIDAEHQLARLMLGVDALRARQYSGARRYFANDGAKGPITELTNALMTGWSQQGAGDLKSALETLKGLEGDEWLTVYRAYNSALLADVSGDEKAAGEYFSEAYRLDGSVLRVAESYARYLARTGKRDEALKVLAAYDKVSKDHPNIIALRAEIEAGRTPEPIVAGTAAGGAESLYQIGGLLARQGGEDVAIIYLQLALYLRPDATMALLTLADVYERQKNHELAAQAYARVAPSSPLHRSAQIQRAHNLDALGQVEQAKAVLDELIEAHPADTDPIRALGDILRAHEQFAESAEMYTRAIDLLEPIGEDDWSLLYYRGIGYERTKRWPQAEADFLHALQLKPEQPFVLNYLGYSWVDQGRNLQQAMTMIRKAVELRSEDGYIVDSLGWAHYRLGEFEAAVRELERAVELKPEDPVINDHLGDSYWRAGRKLEARFQWSHARDLKPEPDELVKILEKLENGLPPPDADRVMAAADGDRLNDATVAPPGGPQTAKPAPAPATETAQTQPDRQETPPAAAEQPETMARKHTVSPGESLWSIANRYYGSGAEYERIFEANREIIRRSDLIHPGQVLAVPEAE